MTKPSHFTTNERRVLSEKLPRPGRAEPLPDDEGHHLAKVLRAREGDPLEVLDGRGAAVKARLVRIGGGKLAAEYTATVDPRGRDRFVPLELGVAILKGEAMEWVIEKCVELGVSRIVPIVSERTVVRIERKGGEAFRERWQRIADQALKQCGRLHRMEVAEPLDLDFRGPATPVPPSSDESPLFLLDEALQGESDSMLDERIRRIVLPSLSPRIVPRIWIGPEGGWTPDEREAIHRRLRAQAVSLGPLILRAETAAITAAAVVSQQWWARPVAPAPAP